MWGSLTNFVCWLHCLSFTVCIEMYNHLILEGMRTQFKRPKPANKTRGQSWKFHCHVRHDLDLNSVCGYLHILQAGARTRSHPPLPHAPLWAVVVLPAQLVNNAPTSLSNRWLHSFSKQSQCVVRWLRRSPWWRHHTYRRPTFIYNDIDNCVVVISKLGEHP
jgi:hypothetical protein